MPRRWTVAAFVLPGMIVVFTARADAQGPSVPRTRPEGYVAVGVSRFGFGWDPPFSGAEWHGAVTAPTVTLGVFVPKPNRSGLSVELTVSLPEAMGSQTAPGGGRVGWTQGIGLTPTNLGFDVRELGQLGSTELTPTSAWGVGVTVGGHADITRRLRFGLRAGYTVRRVRSRVVNEYPFVERAGEYTFRTATSTETNMPPIVAVGVQLAVALTRHVAVVPALNLERSFNLPIDDIERGGVTVVQPGVRIQYSF